MYLGHSGSISDPSKRFSSFGVTVVSSFAVLSIFTNHLFLQRIGTPGFLQFLVSQ
jgi:hypothetical protein